MEFFLRLKRVSTFVFDMDGVLTDGGLLITANNEWLRRMHVRDGYALQYAVKRGYRVVVISGSTSLPVKERLNKLGITDVFMGVKDKKALLFDFMAQKGLIEEELLFMGDDIPDYDCMKMVGVPCCPADAVPEILEVSLYISRFSGGFGCVRDIIEKVLKLNGHWQLETHIRST